MRERGRGVKVNSIKNKYTVVIFIYEQTVRYSLGVKASPVLRRVIISDIATF